MIYSFLKLIKSKWNFSLCCRWVLIMKEKIKSKKNYLYGNATEERIKQIEDRKINPIKMFISISIISSLRFGFFVFCFRSTMCAYTKIPLRSTFAAFKINSSSFQIFQKKKSSFFQYFTPFASQKDRHSNAITHRRYFN